jgi:hypothetical protein
VTRLAIPAKARPALDAFIDRCLDPLPTAVLVDTHYNSLMRQARRDAWDKMRRRLTYLETAVDFYLAEGSYARFVLNDEARGGRARAERDKALPLMREVTAELARTPAPDQAAVAWKRKLSVTYLPVSAAELAKAISEDEAFLAAHPVSRQQRGKKVQS